MPTSLISTDPLRVKRSSCIFSIVNSGAYRIINGTCAHSDSSTSTLAAEEKCPVLRDIDIPCTYQTATSLTAQISFIAGFVILHYSLIG